MRLMVSVKTDTLKTYIVGCNMSFVHDKNKQRTLVEYTCRRCKKPFRNTRRVWFCRECSDMFREHKQEQYRFKGKFGAFEDRSGGGWIHMAGQGACRRKRVGK